MTVAFIYCVHRLLIILNKLRTCFLKIYEEVRLQTFQCNIVIVKAHQASVGTEYIVMDEKGRGIDPKLNPRIIADAHTEA